jgi:hypothetical protein
MPVPDILAAATAVEVAVLEFDEYAETCSRASPPAMAT